MKSSRTLLIFLICAVCLCVAWFSGQSAIERARSRSSSSQKVPAVATPVENRELEALEISTSQKSKESARAARLPAEEDAETQNMYKMLDVIRTAVTSQNKIEDVLTKVSDQTPKVYRDANPETGEMLTIRTENPWPGTRYLHMQFVGENGAKNHFLQHAAFEFKPGAESLAKVAAAIREEFPSLKEPTKRTNDYVRWEAGNNYVVWAKTLNKDDFDDDLFNAYTEKDIGTVRIVVEKGVHEDEE